jgi:DNA primase
VDDIRDAIDPSLIDDGISAFTLPDYVVQHNNRPNVLAWCNKWNIDINNIEVFYDVKEDRVVFPVIHNDKMVDATGRSLGKRLPKWKRYGKNNLPFVHGHGNVAVVVEDCVSAIAVGSGVYAGVAVLGTSLAESHKRYLSQFSTAIIALDPDAVPKTLAFAKELRGYVNDVKVLRVVDDLKYRRKEDFDNLTKLTPKE